MRWMRKLSRLACLALGGLALVGAAAAQTPQAPALPAPAEAGPELVAPGPACAPACGPCYEQVCTKRCVPVPDTKKIVHPEYCCKETDMCLPPKCGFSLFKKKDCCGACGACGTCGTCGDCVKCGKVRTRRVLLKKYVTTEECRTKCEVTHEVELVPVKPKHSFLKKPACCPAPACEVPPGMVPPGGMVLDEPGAAKGPEPVGMPKEDKKDEEE